MDDSDSALSVTYISIQLRTWRWLLPVTLFSIVIVYEILEHILEAQFFIKTSLWWELLLFGLTGPVVVGFVLNWIAGQVNGREEAEAQLQHSLTQLEQAKEDVRRTNVALEQKVNERTQSLLEAYQKVAEQNEALQTLDQLKSEFVSLVSHELRAPLTNINGGLELILAFGDQLDPDIYDSVAIMGRESARLTRLVENILNVSALEAGQLHLKLNPVAVPPLLQRAMQSHRVGAPEYHFQLDIQADLPLVLADESYMHDIVYNLIENAIKYTKSELNKAVIKLAAGRRGNKVWLSITDNGPGIPAEKQKHIFAPFYRLNGQKNRTIYGHGLGLFFARKLIEAQGGEIWLASGLDQGSCFILTIPAVPETGLEEELAYEPDSLTD